MVDPKDPDGQKEIYNGILSTQIKLVRSFSLMTSLIGVAAQPILFLKMENAALAFSAGAFFSFFTFGTPLLVHAVSKKYVTRLYYDKASDVYTAVTYSLFLRPKETKFRASDVTRPEIPSMFTTFKANDVPLFVDSSCFENPKHYGKIMGYDKPIDLRLPSSKKDL